MLEDIKASVERLMAVYEAARLENKSLKEEIRQMQALNEDYRKQIENLEREVDNLRLKNAFVAASEGRMEAKAKIDRMIKEIDKCISLIEG